MPYLHNTLNDMLKDLQHGPESYDSDDPYFYQVKHIENVLTSVVEYLIEREREACGE